MSFSLQVVSTRVGGVPEVLPDDLIRLAEPNVPGQRGNNGEGGGTSSLSLRLVTAVCPIALMDALEDAMQAHHHGDRVPPHEMHKRVMGMYTWQNVAERTEKVTETTHTYHQGEGLV